MNEAKGEDVLTSEVNESAHSNPKSYRNQVIEQRQRVRRLVLAGLLLALTLVFSFVESLLPPPPLPVPAHYGLANVVVMYALFFVGTKEAAAVSTLKVVYSTMTRGILAGWLSFGGTLLSFIALYLFKRLGNERISILLISVISAIAHSVGQLIVSRMILNDLTIRLLLPPFVILAVVSGVVTALLLRLIVPALKSLGRTLL